MLCRNPLSALCTQVTDGTHRSPKLKQNGIPMIKAKHLKYGQIDFVNCDYISYEDYLKGRKRARPEKNNILISNIGSSLGATALVETDIEFNIKNVVLIKPDSKVIDYRYLYYYLSSEKFQQYIWQIISGTAQPFIGLNTLRNIMILYESNLQIQKNIAAILSEYDNKIRNNTRRIKILEEIAQLIYSEWFVNFRFPGYENVRMVESKLGMIPDNWEVSTLSQLCSKVVDGTHYSPKPQKNGYYLVKGQDIVDGFIDFSKCYYITQEEHQKVMRRSRPEKDDIIFSNIGTLGSTVLVDEELEFSIKNVALFKPMNVFYSRYIYLTCSSADILEPLLQKAGGSSQKFFSLKFLRGLEILKPSQSILERFYNVIEPLIKKRNILHRENMVLKSTRDLLLTKFISS